MPLLVDALNVLGDEVEDNSDAWLDKLLGELTDLIRATEDQELREGGLAALEVIIVNKDKFVALGKRSFIMFIAFVAAGRKNDAANEYYRSTASAREIIDSILDDAVDLEKLYRDKEAVKEQALELALILLKGSRLLLPFLALI